MFFHYYCFLQKFTVFPKVLLFVKQSSKYMHSVLLTIYPGSLSAFIFPYPCVLALPIYIVIHPFPFICVAVLVPIFPITVSHPFNIVTDVLTIRVEPTLMTFTMDFIIEEFTFVYCITSDISAPPCNMSARSEPPFKKGQFFFINNHSSAFGCKCGPSNWIYPGFCLTKVYIVFRINHLSDPFSILTR